LDITTTDGSSCYAYLEHCLDQNENELETDMVEDFKALRNLFIYKMKCIGISLEVVQQFKKVSDHLPLSHIANRLFILTDPSFSEKLDILEQVSFREGIMKIKHRVSSFLQKMIHVVRIETLLYLCCYINISKQIGF
jgi:23S rRNA A2030 N6-methylase RlmJ